MLDMLASSYGAALRVRPLISVGLTALMFGSLAVFSRWWLTRFRFGPAEWLWRGATYLRWPAMQSPLLATAGLQTVDAEGGDA